MNSQNRYIPENQECGVGLSIMPSSTEVFTKQLRMLYCGRGFELIQKYNDSEQAERDFRNMTLKEAKDILMMAVGRRLVYGVMGKTICLPLN